MPLRDPVAVYNAANNVEANLIQNALRDAGIDAYATEDVSTAGFWMFGLLPEIHKPQVWVERDDILCAKPILDDYELQAANRRAADAAKLTEEPPIEAVCEECGKIASFPPQQRGTVQECPHCGKYMDVGEMEPTDDSQWQADEEVGQ